ncbi:hypothetical protein SVAN01_09068 [Stagonosporopsis vannaccii]|nr:hypothetical protein SVAN01_09068 [Stagonosporopsis vannaccii]
MDAGEHLVEALEKVSHTMASAASAYDRAGGRKRRGAELWRASDKPRVQSRMPGPWDRQGGSQCRECRREDKAGRMGGAGVALLFPKAAWASGAVQGVASGQGRMSREPEAPSTPGTGGQSAERRTSAERAAAAQTFGWPDQRLPALNIVLVSQRGPNVRAAQSRQRQEMGRRG